MRGGEVGLEADGLEHRGLGEIGKLGLALQVAEVGIRFVIVGPRLDGPLEGLQPFLVAAKGEQDVAEVVEGLGKIGAELHGPAEPAGGLVEPSHSIEKVPHAEQRLRLVGVDLQRAVQPREGVFVVAGIQRQLAEVVVWVGKCQVLGNRGVEGLSGLVIQL